MTVLGIDITIDASTRIEDKSGADIDPFRLAQIDVGNYVEIRGYEGSGGIVATRLEREDLVDFNGEVALRGFVVDSVIDSDFTILGVTVTTIGATVFRDPGGTPISSVDFFSQANGRLAEATGTFNDPTIVATEVQFEN